MKQFSVFGSLALLMVMSTTLIAQRNTLFLNFSDTELGTSYQRNLFGRFGISSSVKVHGFAGGEVYPNNQSLPQGAYTRGYKEVFVSVNRNEGDPFHHNSTVFPFVESSTTVHPNIGFFVEQRDLLLKRLSGKLLLNLNTMRGNIISARTGGFAVNGEGENGEEYLFEYYVYEYSIFWLRPYLTAEVQFDYTFYKNMFAGLNFIYSFGNHDLSEPYGALTLGIRF